MRDGFLQKDSKEQRAYGLEYQIADVDDQSGFPHYYGFMSYTGAYYIMKETLNGSISYSKKEFGSRGSYSQSWLGRAGLIYSTWDSTF